MAKYPLSRNVIEVIGNLVRDPEDVVTPGGKGLTKLTVAVSHGHFDKQANEFVNDFDAFYDVAFWESDFDTGAAFAKEYLRKGDRVFVTGILRPKAYLNQKGEAVPANEIIQAKIDGLTSTALRGTRAEAAPEAAPARRHNAPKPAADDTGLF